jgi:glycosyltransferase involved in cell wall biosynthesis
VSARILFVIPGDGLGSGGSPANSMIFARRQAAALTGIGLTVECFYLQSRTSPRVLAFEFLRFRGALRRFQPQIVHAHFGTMTAMFAALAAGRRPLVITYRGGDLNPASGLRAAAGRLLSQLAALRAARIVCVSGRLRERLWWRRERATVLSSGVDTEIFFPEPREAARARLGWRAEERVVLFNAGRNPLNKRLDLAEAAVSATGRAQLRLEILDGNVAPGLMPTLMNASDCLLVTSDTEGSPSMVQEALAVNLPVVSVDVGDLAQRLEGVAHCSIVERESCALARAIVAVVEPPRRSDGRRTAVEFSLSRVAGELARIYADILGAPAAAEAEQVKCSTTSC